MIKDRVFLVWTNERSKKSYKVAELYKENEIYYFKYIIKNVIEAKKDGFELLIAFSDINKVYDNYQLFSVFESRLPDPKRPEIKEILNMYEMKEYDSFELLKRSGAKLPTDSYEFSKE